jgi:hypothetical protein
MILSSRVIESRKNCSKSEICEFRSAVVCPKERAHVTLLERLKDLKKYRSVTSFSVS